MDPSQHSAPSSEPANSDAVPESAAPAVPAGPPAQAAPVAARPRRWTRPGRAGLLAAAAAAAVILLVAGGTGYGYDAFVADAPVLQGEWPRDERGARALATRLRTRERDLRARLKATAPRGVYIVIDQTHNRLYLKKDEDTLLEAICSAGSGMVLKESGGQKREWVFDTPRGQFAVLSRTENPVWRKPDWAFVEEGEAIPKNSAERLDYGSLGEYALYFGNGFMIHGTLYERLLGRAVSHGCIRVGRDDLRQVWAQTRIGTRIYIY